MLFVKPRQVIEMNNIELEEKGFILGVSTRISERTSAFGNPQARDFLYFQEANEALHLSERRADHLGPICQDPDGILQQYRRI